MAALVVRATRMGWYGLRRRREGEEFEIEDEQQFSKNWMVWVKGPSPKVAVAVDIKNKEKA